MLTPDAQAVIDQRKQETVERFYGDRPLFDRFIRHHVDLDMLTVGCEAWAKTGCAGRMRVDPHSWDGEGITVKGGIILDITTVTDHITDDGEIVDTRAYRCYDYGAPPDQAFCVLTEQQLDVDRFGPPHAGRIRNAIRRFVREVGNSRGPVTVRHAQLLADASRLANLLMQTT